MICKNIVASVKMFSIITLSFYRIKTTVMSVGEIGKCKNEINMETSVNNLHNNYKKEKVS